MRSTGVLLARAGDPTRPEHRGSRIGAARASVACAGGRTAGSRARGVDAPELLGHLGGLDGFGDPPVTSAGIFFVHVMKTGGSALNVRLREWFDAADTYPDDREHRGPRAKTDVDRLLRVRREEGAPRGYYSVHMPAWVAEAVAPDHLRVTILREPVERTISHLRHIAALRTTSASLEEIHDDPRWHDRLTNYQVRLFSSRRGDGVGERVLASAEEPTASAAERATTLPELTTGVRAHGPLGERALAEAKARLDGFVVGTTDDLGALGDRLALGRGRDSRLLPRRNETSAPRDASAALVARIRDENELDAALYAHATSLAAR